MLSSQFKQRAFVKKFVSNLVIISVSSYFLFSAFSLGGVLRLNTGVEKALAANANHLVISEVQTGKTNAAGNDFIELYNPTSEEINLKGFRLVRRTQNAISDTTIKSWTTDTFITAYGFYLWANSGYSTIAVAPDVTTTSTITDNNSIALRQGSKNTGQIVDGLAWGSGHTASLGEGTPPANIGPDKSLERKANTSSTPTSMVLGGPDELIGNAWDTEDNSADFILRTDPQPQNSLSPAESPPDSQGLKNPSFEADNDANGMPDYWTPYNLISGLDGRSSEYSKEGDYSLKLIGTSSKSKSARQRIQIRGNASDVLTLSGWNKTSGVSSTGGIIGVVIHINNTDGTITYKLMNFSRNNHDWTKNTINITANKNYSSADIVVINNYQAGASYFDGLMLTK